MLKISVIWVLLLSSVGVASGQDEAQNAQNTGLGEKPNLPNAGEVQATLKQWVLTRQLIARERAGWTEEKESLADLNEVRLSEMKKLGEFSKAAGSRIAEIDEKRKQFSAEKAELLSWRRELKTQIKVLENELRLLIPLFPLSLRSKVEEAIIRVESPDPERPLQHRTRDVLLVMQACLNFQNTITLDRDIRSIEGEDREVEVLYMGLNQAWYVDQTGKYSGYGTPGLKGWVWTEEAALAVAIRQAIAVQSRQATPAFVTLPFSNAAATSVSK